MLLGSVLVDVVLYVPDLPERGGDVLAGDSLISAGGGYNVMSAAARQGLAAAYAGRHGTGRFGDQVRADLARDGIELLLPPTPDGDTGFCVGLVDATAERTYVTREGVDGAMTDDELARIELRPGDTVYLSGYDLAYAHGERLAAWFAALPPAVPAVFDPGPLVGELEHLDAVTRRADWVSANAREAAVLTGHDDPAAAARALGAGAVVRAGASGCWVNAGAGAVHVPVAPVVPVDTAGAGDTHVGAFVAALARGLAPVEAARWANAAAAHCVGRRGPATGPTLEQVAQRLIRDRC